VWQMRSGVGAGGVSLSPMSPCLRVQPLLRSNHGNQGHRENGFPVEPQIA
jgi:hypothetical protein